MAETVDDSALTEEVIPEVKDDVKDKLATKERNSERLEGRPKAVVEVIRDIFETFGQSVRLTGSDHNLKKFQSRSFVSSCQSGEIILSVREELKSNWKLIDVDAGRAYWCQYAPQFSGSFSNFSEFLTFVWERILDVISESSKLLQCPAAEWYGSSYAPNPDKLGYLYSEISKTGVSGINMLTPIIHAPNKRNVRGAICNLDTMELFAVTDFREFLVSRMMLIETVAIRNNMQRALTVVAHGGEYPYRMRKIDINRHFVNPIFSPFEGNDCFIGLPEGIQLSYHLTYTYCMPAIGASIPNQLVILKDAQTNPTRLSHIGEITAMIYREEMAADWVAIVIAHCMPSLITLEIDWTATKNQSNITKAYFCFLAKILFCYSPNTQACHVSSNVTYEVDEIIAQFLIDEGLCELVANPVVGNRPLDNLMVSRVGPNRISAQTLNLISTDGNGRGWCPSDTRLAHADLMSQFYPNCPSRPRYSAMPDNWRQWDETKAVYERQNALLNAISEIMDKAKSTRTGLKTAFAAHSRHLMSYFVRLNEYLMVNWPTSFRLPLRAMIDFIGPNAGKNSYHICIKPASLMAFAASIKIDEPFTRIKTWMNQWEMESRLMLDVIEAYTFRRIVSEIIDARHMRQYFRKSDVWKMYLKSRKLKSDSSPFIQHLALLKEMKRIGEIPNSWGETFNVRGFYQAARLTMYQIIDHPHLFGYADSFIYRECGFRLLTPEEFTNHVDGRSIIFDDPEEFDEQVEPITLQEITNWLRECRAAYQIARSAIAHSISIPIPVPVEIAINHVAEDKLPISFSKEIRTIENLSVARDVTWTAIKAGIHMWRNEANLPPDMILQYLKRHYGVLLPRTFFQAVFIPLQLYINSLNVNKHETIALVHLDYDLSSLFVPVTGEVSKTG